MSADLAVERDDDGGLMVGRASWREPQKSLRKGVPRTLKRYRVKTLINLNFSKTPDTTIICANMPQGNPSDALRCVKRRLADAVYRSMITDTISCLSPTA